jgi:hypothetical protein
VTIDPELLPSTPERERNWLPLAIAATVVLVVAALLVLSLQNGKSTAKVTPLSAPLDPYAASLTIDHLLMSESGNLAGGKVTYVDGHIANQGTRTVTAIAVQVLFRSPAHQVAQNETLPLRFIRTRDPYVDLEPVSAAPLKPAASQDFRLIFDGISNDWDGAYPEIRIVHVDTK